MNIIRTAGFIAAVGILISEIYDHNTTAAMGWFIASLYMGWAMVEGLLETSFRNA